MRKEFSLEDKMKYYKKKYRDQEDLNFKLMQDSLYESNVNPDEIDYNNAWIALSSKAFNGFKRLFSNKDYQRNVYTENYYYYRSEGKSHYEAVKLAKQQTTNDLKFKMQR